jgi:hypothetical protein
MGRIQEKIQTEEKTCAIGAPQESGEQGSKSMRFAPQKSGIPEAVRYEVKSLKREIEKQFVETGILELPATAPLKNS